MENNKVIKVAIITLVLIGIVAVLYYTGLYKYSSYLGGRYGKDAYVEKVDTDQIEINKNDIINKYDKYALDPDKKDYANPNNIELYKKLYDAVDNIKEKVDISEYKIDDKEFENQLYAIYGHMNLKFFYLKDMSLNKNKNEVKFKYNLPKEEIQKKKQELSDKVNYILNEVVDYSGDEFERELSIYDYITKNTKYNYELDTAMNDVNAYAVLMKNKGICIGYANAMNYLLNRVGIESHVVAAEDNSHVWNIVKIDDNYYHLDATWEADSNAGTELKYFNMTDEERKNNSQYEKWYGGNINFKRLEMPKCTDEKFKYMRNVKDYKLNDGWMDYKNVEIGISKYKMKYDGTQKEKVASETV